MTEIITNKKLEEEIKLLQLENEKLNFIVDNSIDVIWELDRSLKFTYISKSLFNNLGYTQEEWLGHRISEFTTYREFIKMGREAIVALKNFKNFKYTIFETVFIHKNGTPIHFEIIGSVLKDKKGFPLGLFGSTRNITIRKNTEKILRESEKSLKEINESKDKFFSIIAHDLRAPFNSMLGFTNLLLDNFEDFKPSEQKNFIKIINDKLNHTFKLIENLLLWSLSQRGKISFNPEKIILSILTTDTVKLLETAAQNKSIIICNLVHRELIINGDRNILSTIIRNLLSNAIKFTPKNGKIIITADLKSKANNKEFIEISVIDNGIGIPKKNINNLFDNNINSSTNGTDNETGSGLGLSLCNELIKICGGEIRVESKIQEGSTFIITLPT